MTTQQLTTNRGIRALVCICALFASPALRAADQPGTYLGYELIGQVLNVNPSQSLQYGYLSRVSGLDPVATQARSPITEATALLTFYNDTTTQQVINNGPLRVIDRTGTATIYFNAGGGGDFGTPDSFRAGKPVQTSTLRHQVVIDTSTGYFTASFELAVNSVTVFTIAGASYHLGNVGQVYHWNVYGKLTATGPPSAQIAGFASDIKAEPITNNF